MADDELELTPTPMSEKYLAFWGVLKKRSVTLEIRLIREGFANTRLKHVLDVTRHTLASSQITELPLFDAIGRVFARWKYTHISGLASYVSDSRIGNHKHWQLWHPCSSIETPQFFSQIGGGGHPFDGASTGIPWTAFGSPVTSSSPTWLLPENGSNVALKTSVKGNSIVEFPPGNKVGKEGNWEDSGIKVVSVIGNVDGTSFTFLEISLGVNGGGKWGREPYSVRLKSTPATSLSYPPALIKGGVVSSYGVEVGVTVIGGSATPASVAFSARGKYPLSCCSILGGWGCWEGELVSVGSVVAAGSSGIGEGGVGKAVVPKTSASGGSSGSEVGRPCFNSASSSASLIVRGVTDSSRWRLSNGFIYNWFALIPCETWKTYINCKGFLGGAFQFSGTSAKLKVRLAFREGQEKNKLEIIGGHTNGRTRLFANQPTNFALSAVGVGVAGVRESGVNAAPKQYDKIHPPFYHFSAKNTGKLRPHFFRAS